MYVNFDLYVLTPFLNGVQYFQGNFHNVRRDFCMVEGAIGDIKRYRVTKTGFEFVGMKLADNIVIDMTGVRRLFNGRDSELTVETVRLKPEVREFFNNYLAYWKAIDNAKDEIKRITELYQKKIQQETAEINKNIRVERWCLVKI